MISRRRWLAGLGSIWLMATSQTKAAELPRDAITRTTSSGIAWLLRQQADDGGWHSATYGNLRDGIGITALVLKALVEVTPHLHESLAKLISPAITRGIAYLTATSDKHGLVCGPNKSSDNPVYATALLLDALHSLPNATSNRQTAQRLLAALQQAQFGPANHCPETALEFGGWGSLFPVGVNKLPGDAANISVTSHALRTLQRYDRLDDATAKRAASFLNRCRGGKGYAFVPDPHSPLNKLGTEQLPGGDLRARGYASATCDACLAWLALGSKFVEPYQSALTAYTEMPLPWLWTDNRTRPSREIAAQAGLYFYHAARLGELWRATSNTALGARILLTTEQLVTHLQIDGSWQNSIDTMREDDPLIATALGLMGLMRGQSP
ncbi:hypothetical protein [Blastopirellula marina]|uniref:Uncharacterized protein n=1 Tax=Blastopirellula marina TaxID=124 RepID=A0A2S8FHV2_9BACT|nr:hypothetical protein [Blastopirellula marina]PQO31650.1 hypothetical protein C5Y98_19740 [Blastopirellula marina]